ncbi:MAG TPA: hypothetical protein VNJ11_06880 [Bryobacteraceae bacterium]|nr:hypothetical protein [Bryobacteraceae bacterium]
MRRGHDKHAANRLDTKKTWVVPGGVFVDQQLKSRLRRFGASQIEVNAAATWQKCLSTASFHDRAINKVAAAVLGVFVTDLPTA